MDERKLPHDHGPGMEACREEIPESAEFQAAASLFRLLDDVSRVRIFWLLCRCEACVTNISALMGMSSPAVSHHLRQLKAGGLITGRRAGKEVYYKAADSETARLLRHTIEKIMGEV